MAQGEQVREESDVDGQHGSPAVNSQGRGHQRVRLTVLALLMLGVILAFVAGIREMTAAGSLSLSVEPNRTTQLYYKPTPFAVTINAAHLSGTGHTPVSGYQYALQWDPNVIQWVAGPAVQAGTPTPQPVLPCGWQVITSGSPTPTPTNFVPTFTPTATHTPGAGTPTNTPPPTNTPTKTPTPGGYIKVGCATIGNATPHPNGIVGTFKFQPVAAVQASSPLNLVEVKMVNRFGTPVSPAPVVNSGSVLLAACHDLNGDGHVNILDLSLLASRFLTSVGHPNYVPEYDVNGDGQINIIDISLVAAAFLLSC